MKNFSRILYILMMAVIVLSLSGCDDDEEEQQQTSAENERLVVISSSAFSTEESYRLYMGDGVTVMNTQDGANSDLNAKYYVAPLNGGEMVTMNLEFEHPVSWEVPFVITKNSDNFVVFAYNPSGEIFSNTSIDYGKIIRTGGDNQQLRYNGLGLTTASLAFDRSDETIINLNGTTASIDNYGEVEEQLYVWHADPDHMDEYYTDGINGTEEYDMDGVRNELFYTVPDNGIFIAHDIKYMTNAIEFDSSQTASRDNNAEYVLYYSDAVSSIAAEEDGLESGTYIFASLPMNSGDVRTADDGDGEEEDEAEENTDDTGTIAAFATMTHSPQEAYSNPVLHITKPGTYRLRGTWHGQIRLDPGASETITLILDGVNITCDVAPAIVFGEVKECGLDVDIASVDVGSYVKENAGARLIIANRSTNNLAGANVYRILKAQKASNTSTVDGTNINAQNTLCSMNGALYSSVSLVVGAESNNGGGRLNVRSTTYDGISSGLHLTADSGTITITAENDGVSVSDIFTMSGGSLKVTAKNGSGIFSTGSAILSGGTADITAYDDKDITAGSQYISDNTTYTHQAYSYTGDNNGTDYSDNSGGNIGGNPGEDTANSARRPVTITNENDDVVFLLRFESPDIDTEMEERTINGDGVIFTLQHRVNHFGGIRINQE